MAKFQKDVEEKKKAQKIVPAIPPRAPFAKNHQSMAAVGSMYSQGLLSKTDSDKARKIAELQLQIKNKINSGLLGNIPVVERPKPLILDESGRTIDITGKEVHLTQVVPTLKANIRAKKREEFKAQMQDAKGPEDYQETHFFDNRIGVKPSIRGKRALKFHEPGKFMQIAERIRMKAQLEKLQNEISQIARKTGISSATKLALIAPKTEAMSEDVPNVEWWDSVILSGNPAELEDVSKVIKVSTITNLVEHPAQMRAPSKKFLFLIKKI